jgi:hypothetical protein
MKNRAKPMAANVAAMIQKRTTTVRLAPPLLLEVVVQRRHEEDAATRSVVADATWIITDSASHDEQPADHERQRTRSS